MDAPAAVLMAIWLVSSASCQLLRTSDRSVNCNSEFMEVVLEFAQPFNGIIYADNFYERVVCRWPGNGTRTMIIPVPLNTNAAASPYCGVTVQENSGEFRVTLVITPVKGLLVDGMSGLNVHCIYNIDDITITLPTGPNGAGILINRELSAASNVVTGSGGNPFLQMTIRDGHGINGDLISAATVGQPITLDIIMKDTAIYDFYAHDCYAHDGTNAPDASITIIDENGCAVRLARAVDVPVFSTPPVSGGSKHVYVHLYGFQFTTSQFVYFECQVRPCLHSCQRKQCQALSNNLLSANLDGDQQPHPAENRVRRQVAEKNLQDNYRLQAVLQIKAQNVLALAARDEPVPADQAKPQHASSPKKSRQRLCLSLPMALILVGVLLCVAVFSAVLMAILCRRPPKRDKRGPGVIKTGPVSGRSSSDRNSFTSSSYYGIGRDASSPSPYGVSVPPPPPR